MKKLLSFRDDASETAPVNQSDRPQPDKRTDRIVADNPIRTREEDLLGRAKAAESFARQVLALDASQGVVVAVLGPWGSGKTSFVNLARTYLESVGVQILDFNPWMFSGAEQLVDSFFVELSSQLKVRPGLADIGADLEEYGEGFSGMAWLPVVGPWIERGRGATKLLSKILQRRKEGISGRRGKVAARLAELGIPFAVVVDDIDRLTTAEIRDVFKLVRLTANFPNIIYLLAFDRKRVESALAEQGIPGRDYLEKILQVAIDLPETPPNVFNRQIFQALDKALGNLDDKGAFDQSVWPDVFVEVVRPLLRNMRDVRRYVAAVSGSIEDLRGQVALVDLLGVEAIRVFLPDAFALMHSTIDGLTTTSNDSYSGRQESEELKKQVERWIESAGPQEGVLRAAVQRLFPAASRHIGGTHYGGGSQNQWLRERRVAHEDILRLYVERVVGDSLRAFTDAERAWQHMADRRGLESYLGSLDRERLRDVIAALEVYQDKFTAEQVAPGTIALLNLLPAMPKRERGMFEFDDSMVVGRVVYRLVRIVEKPDTTERMVREILPELTTLTSRAQLISMVGHKKGSGHKLVSEQAAADLEREWRHQVRSAKSSDLIAERDLLRILFMTMKEALADEPPLQLDPSPQMTLALMRSARGETKTQGMGSRGVRRFPRLAWEVLAEIYGSEDILRERIAELESAGLSDTKELLELAKKYAGGWRPERFPDDDE